MNNQNPYESERLRDEYLLFHYAVQEEIMQHLCGPVEALDYAVRCVTECMNVTELSGGRGLDLGCAVGRSTFEMSRYCREVVGIDYSNQFIETAKRLQQEGVIPYFRVDEGDLKSRLEARVPAGIDRRRVSFEQGDAMRLRENLGVFDVVLMANLVDRLKEPALCLKQLAGLIRGGGQLVITSPYTWLEEYTAQANWLGGFERDGRWIRSLDGLLELLSEAFELIEVKNLPFLIREHARKFQWSIAEASVWRRKD